MANRIKTLIGIGLLVAATGVATAATPSKTTTTTKGETQVTSTSQTINAEIIQVEGNTVVAKTDQGTREFKLPDGFKFQFEGKEIGVADLKPGMKVSATVTTTTKVTPVTVTEVREAEVLLVSGTTIVVRGPDGNKKWTSKDISKAGIKIMMDGKQVDVTKLKAGDKVTAVIISSKPPIVESGKTAKASAKAAPAPAPEPAAAPAPAPAPAPEPAAAPAPKKLPKTGSPLPLVGLSGALSLLAGLGLSARRRLSK